MLLIVNFCNSTEDTGQRLHHRQHGNEHPVPFASNFAKFRTQQSVDMQ